MTKILAVIDPRETSHHALERCREQPPESELDIHAALFVENESAQKFAKTFTERLSWLREQVVPYVADGYTITTEVVPFTNLYSAVIETATKRQSDFVVKPMRQHSLFQTVLRTSTDWNLIRHCPFPLLLVGDQDRVKGKPVIAAVDVCTGDQNHEALNSVVLKQALRLAEVFGSEVHAVNAWRQPTQIAAVGAVDATPYPTGSQLHTEHRDALRAVLAEFNVSSMHVDEGSPDYVINHVADKIGAGVIVMGTVARKGISGALIGNTAEGVLEAAHCDVMVVKLPAR